jgi:class 3 adenylate cyclase
MTWLTLTDRDARSGTRPAELAYRRARLAPLSSDAEHKVLTVLFADIRGSMPLSRSVELDEWWSVLAGLFELMCEGVYSCGGWVGNFTGDGVQAIFETPGRHVEHAHRACEAALWLRDSLRKPTAEFERERRFKLEVRIGINSGEVLIGTIGERYSRHYTACGYAVALAKRMETLARPGGIYLTEHTAALISHALELSDLGLFEVKGAQSPLGVFELIG